MKVDFEIGNFPIPLIGKKIAQELDLQSGDSIVLKKNNIPIQILSIAIARDDNQKLLLPDFLPLELDHCKGNLTIQKFTTAPKATKVMVEFKDKNHLGVSIENVRKQIIDIHFFVSGQSFLIKPDDREIRVKIHCEEFDVFQVNQNSRICIKGDNIPTIEDIGGQKELVDWYNNHYLFALKAKDYLKKWHIPSPRGLLLSGLPGLGKTHFLKAMVADSGVYHVSIFASNIITPLAGDGDMVIMDTFEKARKNSPAIISIDEIDALCLKRSDRNQNYENRIVTVLLQEMDGVLSRDDVFVIGATNRPQAIDQAFLRPGRLSKHITLSLPKANDRVTIFNIHLKHTQHNLTDQDLIELAHKTDGYTPAQIADVIHRAAISRIKKHLDFKEQIIINKQDLLENILFNS